MSDTPWAVRRTKRERPATTPRPRKRARISDDVTTKISSNTRSKDQKTLTQIQWVATPPMDDENEEYLEEIEVDRVKKVRSARPAPRRLLKRGSTLTQMQWIGSPLVDREDEDDLQELGVEEDSGVHSAKRKGRELKRKDSTLTQMEWLGDSFKVYEDNRSDDDTMLSLETKKGSMSQVDGPTDSPRKSKKRKAVSVVKDLTSSSSIERETQDYVPTQRRMSISGANHKVSGGRRKSGRIASKQHADSDVNLGISGSNPSRTATELHNVKVPPLEIMDSYDIDDDQTPTQVRPIPQTPRKRCEVPSSQTPESILQSKRTNRRKFDDSPSKSAGRTPLGNKSANIRSNIRSQGIRGSKAVQDHSYVSPKRSKVCVLKVPSRGLLQRSSRKEDSQQDVYSLKATSSPSRGSAQSEKSTETTPKPSKALQRDADLEIPSTSQMNEDSEHSLPSSPPQTVADASLPDLCDLIPPPQRTGDMVELREIPKKTNGFYQASNEDAVGVRDFGRSHSQKSQDVYAVQENPNADHEDEEMLLDLQLNRTLNTDQAEASVAEGEADDNEDARSEFGSPSANDTQFNVGVVARLSSPDILTDSDKDKLSDLAEDDSTSAKRPELAEHSIDIDIETDMADLNTQTPMPKPKLLEKSQTSIRKVHFPVQHDEDSEATGLLPTLSKPQARSTSMKVPLNDTPYTSSSSPSLPPVRRAQPNVYPASMPRPSQMSTQEPTQNYSMFLSSMPPPTQHHTQVEPITIKDSSSVRLSQIPEHESQSRALKAYPLDESDDDIDDLDLDPSSVPQGRQSARKPSGLLRKETNSSLRSIHPASDRSGETSSDIVRSSSPLLRESALRQSNAMKPPNKRGPVSRARDKEDEFIEDSDETSSPISSPRIPALTRHYDPLPGFDNDTQSNFTQNGHITAAYIHRQRETGAWPDWFVPEPYQVQNWKAGGKKR